MTKGIAFQQRINTRSTDAEVDQLSERPNEKDLKSHINDTVLRDVIAVFMGRCDHSPVCFFHNEPYR